MDSRGPFYRLVTAERDAALVEARLAQAMLQGYIDQANENAIRVHELERERDAALAREAVLRRALETFPLTVAQRDAAWFSLACLRAETATLEANITAMREQLALRDARIAALEEAVRHVLDDARPARIISPGSAVVGNHAITMLKNAMYVGEK